MNFGQAFED
ncbi:Protein of unknown function [Bacillus wiedmannii]|nr:Protein of unknown function [Bacillus wiedmannii]